MIVLGDEVLLQEIENELRKAKALNVALKIIYEPNEPGKEMNKGGKTN